MQQMQYCICHMHAPIKTCKIWLSDCLRTLCEFFSGTETTAKNMFLHDICERIFCQLIFTIFSQKRNEKHDSFTMARHGSSMFGVCRFSIFLLFLSQICMSVCSSVAFFLAGSWRDTTIYLLTITWSFLPCDFLLYTIRILFSVPGQIRPFLFY